MQKDRVFVSYSHHDSRWIEEGPQTLIPWLAKALRNEGIEFWYDHSLRQLPGIEFEKCIQKEIDDSSCAMLLLSQDFINSEFISKYELPWIQKRVESNAQILIPILVGPVLNEDLGWLSSRQIIPGKPTPLIDYIANPASWLHVRQDVLLAVKRRIRPARKNESALSGAIEDSAVGSHTTGTSHTSDSAAGNALAAGVQNVRTPKTVTNTETSQSPSNAFELRSKVAHALASIESKAWKTTYGDICLTDCNSGHIWAELVKQQIDVRYLIETLIEKLQSGSPDDKCKAMFLLSKAVRARQGQDVIHKVAEVVEKLVAEKAPVMPAAVTFLAEAPLPRSDLIDVLTRLLTETKIPHAAFCLSNVIPKPYSSEEVACIGVALCNAVRLLSMFHGRSVFKKLREMRCEEVVNCLCGLLVDSDLTNSLEIAGILSEWKVSIVGPSIREAIENHRYSTDSRVSQLLCILYDVNGNEAGQYIANVLKEAHPPVQIEFLKSRIGRQDGAIRRAVIEILQATDNKELHQLGKALLDAN